MVKVAMLTVLDLKTQKLKNYWPLTKSAVGRDFVRVPDLMLFRDGDRHAMLYSYLSSRLYKMPSELARRMEMGERLHYKELEEEGIYVRSWNSSRESRNHEICLNLTTGCSLRCDYCRSHGGEVCKSLPSKRMASTLEALSKAFGDADVNLSFGMHGESTTNFGTMQAAIAAARKSFRRVKCSLSTNGYLLEWQARWLGENMDSMGVSYDGLPEIQDAHRPAASGVPSSDVVERTIRILSRSKCRLYVNSVMVKDVLGREGEIVAHVKSLGTRNYNVMPFARLGRGRSAAEPTATQICGSLKRFFIAGFKEGISVDFSGLIRNQGTAFSKACNFERNFVVGTDGSISACMEFMNKGAYARRSSMRALERRLNGPEKLRLETQKFKGMKEESAKKCEGCDFYWICGGGCFLKVSKPSFSIKRCHARKHVKAALKAYIEAATESFF